MYNKKLRNHLQNYKKSDYLKVEAYDSKSEKVLVDCSFGVNPFGHSKNIKIFNFDKHIDISNYSELGAFHLRRIIIDNWYPEAKLNYENLAISDGSMGIIDSINSLFINEGDRVLGYSPQFPEFVESLKIRGGIYAPVLLQESKNYKFNPDDIISCLKENVYKLVYIDNPNNPTGQVISIQEIERIIKQAEEVNTIVIIDEAYGDYMPRENSAIKLIGKYNNFYVIKSFSKAYSLAGIRIGYVAGSKELMKYYSIIDDYLVNQVAVNIAEIALNDENYLKKTIEKTRNIKADILSSINKLKVLETDISVPIFTAVCQNKNINLYKLMRSTGINTSSGFLNLGENAVRIRIPKESEMLKDLLKGVEEKI
ncbi:aminotransferase class I/II-fold pyridoxal phosphate-dependent enzyme [Sedimentibacter sp.]|uniref:pyridoxal phosphate-dependent aminotransferase n=1 Tax=Sedimentibacter sp. TaxID=1960295 RepID=UPI0028A9A77F|nr:aminotransferase class I/II-fold pyridoxal phosphate-dependent enzyme [Sedimentibacter sp.]